MSRVVLKIKDENKARALLKVLESMDFVEVQESSGPFAKKSMQNSFFEAAGIWKNREIDSDILRNHGNGAALWFKEQERSQPNRKGTL